MGQYDEKGRMDWKGVDVGGLASVLFFIGGSTNALPIHVSTRKVEKDRIQSDEKRLEGTIRSLASMIVSYFRSTVRFFRRKQQCCFVLGFRCRSNESATEICGELG